MNILAIDSSGLVATIALLYDDILVGEYTIHNKKTHSQTLLPMIDDMMKMAGMDVECIDAIAVANGPGSFTGLRIGASTAKGLSLALDVPVIPVSTLEGLAYNALDFDGVICPIMDARRNQAYYGLYKSDGIVPVSVEKEDADDIMKVIELVNAHGEKVIFLGDGVPVFKETIDENIKVECKYISVNNLYQKASSVAALAKEYYKEGKLVNGKDFEVSYLRVSQAERERAEKNQSN